MKRSDLDAMTVLRLIGEKPDDWRGSTAKYLEGKLPGVPPKVIVAKLGQLDVRGLVDCGVAIEYCFLTRKGRQVIAEAGPTATT